MCWGGCLKDRLFPRQDYGAPSYFCAAYRKFFEHTHARFQVIAQTVVQNRPQYPASR
jgi:sulfatase maturation enzyme AslB (radical SAM superfamily)